MGESIASAVAKQLFWDARRFVELATQTDDITTLVTEVNQPVSLPKETLPDRSRRAGILDPEGPPRIVLHTGFPSSPN